MSYVADKSTVLSSSLQRSLGAGKNTETVKISLQQCPALSLDRPLSVIKCNEPVKLALHKNQTEAIERQNAANIE